MSFSPVELVTSAPQLKAVIEGMAGQPRFALDTESNSFYCYPERVCLVQVAAAGQAYLIDPSALQDLAPLGSLLADESVEKVLHSAGNDLRSLDREWGFRVQNLFDTSMAAAFIGMRRLGLAAVLAELLRVSIDKDTKLQRADWGRRPLDDRLVQYAAADVTHLLRLREILGQRLVELRREDWVAEECARLSDVRYVAPDPHTAFLSVKGSRDLDGRALAVLKALVQFREREALRLGRPHFRVIPDAALVELAASPEVAPTEVAGVGPYSRPPLVERLRRAIEEGGNGPPLRRADFAAPRRRWLTGNERQREALRLRSLKEWRTQIGSRLSLDPALLWPAVSLERLAQEPDRLEGELDAPEVRRWQQGEFAESLRVHLAGL